MGFLEKVRNIINREIKSETEPKETAVLVRVLSIVDILFMCINLIYMLVEFPIGYGLGVFALLIVSVGVLMMSYFANMHMLICCYYLSVFVSGVYFTICLGVLPMYHLQLFIVILLFFYRSSETSVSRVLSVLLSGIVGVAAVFYVSENGVLLESSENVIYILIVVNTMFILGKVTLFAYFFMLKFSASETKILQYSKKLEMIATTDPLTKLQNRRGMINHLDNILKEKNDKEFSLTLGIGDIDFFKKVNDTYGHEAGDYVLETVAKIMDEFMKGKGMVARWGGEEFLFSFEGYNGDYAFESLSKLLHIIERYEFSFEGIYFKVTMTFGLEEYDANEDVEKIISKADEKLYMGKEAGRDRVVY